MVCAATTGKRGQSGSHNGTERRRAQHRGDVGVLPSPEKYPGTASKLVHQASRVTAANCLRHPSRQRARDAATAPGASAADRIKAVFPYPTASRNKPANASDGVAAGGVNVLRFTSQRCGAAFAGWVRAIQQPGSLRSDHSSSATGYPRQVGSLRVFAPVPSFISSKRAKKRSSCFPSSTLTAAASARLP